MLQSNRSQLAEYFVLPNPKLTAYFGIVKKGKGDVVRTPIGKRYNTKSLLDSWKSKLDRGLKLYPDLYNYEMEMMAKVGPMSVQEPLENRIESIQQYYSDVNVEPNPILNKAIKAVLAEWRPIAGITSRSVSRTIDNMKLSTNSGNPFFTRRSEAIDMMHEAEIIRTTMTTLQVIDSVTWNTCATLGWRGQEGGPTIEDVKQRVVWMFPLLINIAELCVYQPAIEAVQRFNLIPAYVSMDAVDANITRMFDTKGRFDVVMCTDFTSFDSHFNFNLQNAAKEILAALLDHSDTSRRWMEVVYPIKYNIDLACQPDLILKGSHGMGSGSGGTNFDESLAHRALQYEAAISQKARLNIYSQCLGDDGVLTYPGIDPVLVTKSYSAHGLEMNQSKQYVSMDDCIYLRRWHHADYRSNGICVGVYSTMRALGRIIYQERFYEHWSNKMVALRQLSILENVKFHPMKEEFVDFCIEKDKFKLGLEIPGFFDRLNQIVNEATAYMPDFLGYTKSLQKQTSINDWWIVQYLKKIA